jgi:hypothetical protein
MNRLIFSTLICFKFKDLQWSECIEIFLNEYYLGQLYQPRSLIAKHIGGAEAKAVVTRSVSATVRSNTCGSWILLTATFGKLIQYKKTNAPTSQGICFKARRTAFSHSGRSYKGI